MNKLAMELATIKYLTGEVEQERMKLEFYQQAKQQALRMSEEKQISFYDCFKWNEPVPSKTKIKEYLKTIRRLTMQIEKRINYEY